MKEEKFNFWVPAEFEKAQKKGGETVMRIKGIASTDDKDSEGEVLIPIGFELQRFLDFGHINWNHQGKNDPSKIIGEPDVARITPKGELYIEGELYKGHPLAKAAWEYAETLKNNGSNRKLGWSIEGRAMERDPMNPKRITKALITGVALTPTPVNVNTYVDLCKGEAKENFIDYEFEEGSELKKSEGEFLYEFDVEGKRYGINKSFELVDIEKAEGDRGGIVIGHTKSGKPIYDSHSHPSHKDFSHEEHSEASWTNRVLESAAQNSKHLLGLRYASQMKSGQVEEAKISSQQIREQIGMMDKYYTNKMKHLSFTKSEDFVDIEKEGDTKEKKIAKVMGEFKAGTLKSSSGDIVTDKDQALAIAMSEVKNIEKTMDIAATKPLVPESLDKKPKVLEPELKKAILSGLLSTEQIIDVIQKGGEGSRGGKVIGHTKSGKPIYDSFGHPDHKEFTKQDHSDAKKAHFEKYKSTKKDKHLNEYDKHDKAMSGVPVKSGKPKVDESKKAGKYESESPYERGFKWSKKLS